MTTTPAQGTPPLLDDDAMREAERRIRERVDALAVLKLVRSTYETERVRLIAELAESQRYALQLERNLSNVLTTNTGLRERIAELERALGEAWTPVPDGEVAWGNIEVKNDGGTLVCCGGYDDLLDAYEWHEEYDMPSDYRLCRRTTVTDAAPVPSAEVIEAIRYMASTYWLAHAGPNKTYDMVIAWLDSIGGDNAA